VKDRIWDRPVIVLYREQQDQPTREALAVLRARRLTLVQEEENDVITGRIEDFFPLMGDISGIQSDPTGVNRYILCIYNQGEKPFDQPDRLSGLIFPEGLSFIRDQHGKRTYHGCFQAANR
jgi:hypothetical protein